MTLDKDSDIVDVLKRIGNNDFDLSSDKAILESFSYTVYSKTSQTKNLCDLQWELFRTNNAEAEKLHSTFATLESYACSESTHSRNHKQRLSEANPQIPHLIGND